MIGLFALLLLPLLYGMLYIGHSIRTHRVCQAVAVGVLLLLVLAALGIERLVVDEAGEKEGVCVLDRL